MRAAIFDFGTNTFNLLVAEKSGDGFRILYSGKQPVKLGKGGINDRNITPEAMERGYRAIANHFKTIETFGVSDIHAYATSAIRNAGNGKVFAEEIHRRFGFSLNIIAGDEEAALIYEGVRESVRFGDETAMILDIGGGSNEFIICHAGGILWKQSFELGMARIIEMFTISDPITSTEANRIEMHYKAELKPLLVQAEKYNPTLLVGASGTFDTIAAMAQHRYKNMYHTDDSSREVSLEHFRELLDLILTSTTKERLLMPGMEPVRVEMIVPAMIFINFVINKCNLVSIRQTNYALKEGVMSRLIK
ncbi:MAG: hypothetical protein WD052_03275 [Bacteroidales bacterium]